MLQQFWKRASAQTWDNLIVCTLLRISDRKRHASTSKGGFGADFVWQSVVKSAKSWRSLGCLM